MKIAAFNVKNLGVRKLNKDIVRNNLIKIVSRYSVVVLLEVRDPNGRAMNKFLTELNRHGKVITNHINRGNRSRPYRMEISAPVGRNSYREQFVFFYRQDEMSVIDRYQYEEENENVLAREPFIVQFRRRSARRMYEFVKKLVLIPVHTKPKDAEHELRALHNVVQDARKRWGTNSIMILGDFNADGRYLSSNKRTNIRMSSRPYFWLIDEDADTTTSDLNDHTYDRIVVFGKRMNDAVVPGSAKPFDFKRAYRLNYDTTRSVSDHYPVEVELRDN
ncbi:deoxyribonuclease-1-like [Oreochromis aureus]|uniref:deoxyribonuclease-1-like n=1 Tax=Oreochromis aureus TaxID=47969 RepID=UPI001954AA95|nr:deoxyribonuclease-1-like [Oreochromis aureus]